MSCNIKPGSTGENVKQLQRFLNVTKDYNGSIDGQYGPLTKSAVIKYQKRHRLVADGKAGPITTSHMQLQCVTSTTTPNPSPIPSPIQGKGPIQTYTESRLGSFNSMTEFYNKLKGKGYNKYYNDVKTRTQTINSIVNPNPNYKPNCSDIMQVFHDLAIEMGYECRYVHVQCKEGGHVRGQIRGKEFGSTWTRVDPAAALSVGSQYPIGKVWCDYPNAHIENSAWLNIDDGKT